MGANPHGANLLGKPQERTTQNGYNGNEGFLGASSGGTLFKINTDGTGYTNLYSFTEGNNSRGPCDSLILVGNTFYGTTLNGGGPAYGERFWNNLCH